MPDQPWSKQVIDLIEAHEKRGVNEAGAVDLTHVINNDVLIKRVGRDLAMQVCGFSIRRQIVEEGAPRYTIVTDNIYTSMVLTGLEISPSDIDVDITWSDREVKHGASVVSEIQRVTFKGKLYVHDTMYGFKVCDVGDAWNPDEEHKRRQAAWDKVKKAPAKAKKAKGKAK